MARLDFIVTKTASRLILLGLMLTMIVTTTDFALAQSDNSKALRYHSVLLKRPNPGYLYDRFYNAWLDTGTIEELSTFLNKRVTDEGTTADRLLLAFFHVKQGEDVKALQQFGVALEKDPKNAQAWYHKASIEARTLDFETAIKDLDSANKAEPDEKLTTAIAKLQGKLYVRNRQTSKALAVWKKLLDAHPDDEELYEDIIELQIAEGLYDEAAALSEKLITRTTDKYEKVVRRIRTGDIHHRAGKRTKALEVYSSTLEQVGHGTWLEREILAQIEQLFRREDDLTGLKEQYQKLLEQYEKRIQLHKQYARLLSELGETADARKQFEEILKLTPGDRTNVEAYITMLASSDMLDDAIKAMQALIKQNPDDGELHLQLAGLHNKAKDKKSAGEAVAKYLESSDKTEYAFLRSARLLKQFELKEEAEKTYESLTKKFPDSVAAHEARAAFLFENEKKDEALAIWQGLAKGKDRARVVHVARILAARNEHQAAYDLLSSRSEDFGTDAIFLGQLVLEAIALKKYEEALPPAQRRVQLARTTSDLEGAVAQAAQVAEKAEKTDELIAQLVANEKRSTQNTCLLAELYERRGDGSRADEVLAKASTDDTLLVISQQIRLHTQRRDWSKAAKSTKRLIESPDGRKTIHVRRLVELYERDFRIDEALRWVQEWKKLSPGSTIPWMTESRLYTTQGKTKEAINTLRTAAQQFEDDPDVRSKLAQSYVDAGKMADAERIYWRLYEDAKDLTGKLRWVQQLAMTAEFQGTNKELIEKFEERRKTNRTSVEPLLALAEIHRVGDGYEDRRKMLLEATRLKADNLPLLYQIARIEEKEGDWERALATLQRAAKLDKTTRAQEQMARIHLNYGNADQGYAILFELVGKDKTDPRSVEAIAEAMMSVQDWERAVEFLSPLVSKFANDYRLHYLLAVAQEEAGEDKAALESFLGMLKMDKEIPGLTAKAPQTPWVGFAGPLATLVPQESIDYLQLGWMSELVYSHRNQRGGRMIPSMFGSGANQIQMPYDLESSRQYAMAHILKMGSLMSEEEAEDLAVAMREQGVGNAKVLIEMQPSMRNMENMTGLAKKFPKEKGLVALAILMNMEGFRQADPELAITAHKMFKESRPQLAFMAALQASSIDPENVNLLDASMKEMATVENPNLFLVMSISTSLGGRGFGRPRESALPDEYKQKLTNQLVKWYPKLSNLGPQGIMVFFTVAQALSQGEDPANYFAFLDEEVTRFNSKSSQTSSQMMQRFSGMPGNQGLIKPLSFPPQTLPNFPPQIAAMLSSSGGPGPFGEMMPQDWDEEKIAAALPKIKDPTLKILVANRFDLQNVVNETLDEMLKAESPSVDAYLMGAAKAIANEDYKVASELLDKSRYLPMRREVRKQVDAALVSIAMDQQDAPAERPEKPKSAIATGLQKALAALRLLSKGDKNKPNTMQSIGREAALRLRRANLQPNERQELVAALDTLGLSDEANKLENRIGNPSVGIMTPSAHSTRSQTQRISQLMADGKQDQAIRLIVTDLNALAQTALSNPSYMRHNRYETRQLLGLIRSHGLEEQVMAKVDPGNSTSTLKLGQYGVICEMLDKKELALVAYGKYLEKRPKEDSIRIRMFTLTAATDVKKAIEHLELVQPRSSQLIGAAVAQVMQDDSHPIEPRIQVAEAVNEYLKNLKDTEKIELSWVTQVVEQLAGHQNHNDIHLQSFYYVNQPQREQSEEADKLDQMRRKIHDAMCQTMLTIPQLAPVGFTRLLALAERDGKVTDEFSKMALDALLAYKPPRATFGVNYPSTTYYGSDGSKIQFRTPEEYLVRSAWKNKNVALINEEVVPALTKANKSKVAKKIQEELLLYTTSPEEFLEAATKRVATEARANPGISHGEENPAVNKIIEIWDERKLKTSIEPIILNSLKEIVNSGNYYGSMSFTEKYIVALSSKGSPDDIQQFSEKVAEMFLGPKEKRAELIKKHYDRNSVTSGTINGKITGFVRVAEQLVEEPKTMFVALQLLNDHGLLNDVDSASYRIDQVISSAKEDKADKVIAFLETSPFFNDLDKLEVYTDEDSAVTVMGGFMQRTRNHGDELRDELAKKIGERDPKTFGAGLFQAYLTKEKPTESVMNFLVEHEAELKKHPKEKQQKVASLFNHLSENQTLDLTEDGERVHEWLNKLRANVQSGLVQEVLEAKRIEDLKMDMYDLKNRLENIMPHVIASDAATAKKVFLKLADLIEDGKKRGSQLVYSYSSSSSVVGQLLAESIDDQPNLEKAAFVLDVVGSKEGTIELTRWASNELNQALNTRFNAILQKVASDEKQRELVAFKKLYEEMNEAFVGRPNYVLVNSLRNPIGRLDSKEREDAIKWIATEVAKEDRPPVAATFDNAFKLYASISSDPFNADGSKRDLSARVKLEEFHQTYLTILTNSDESISIRLALADALMSAHGNRAPTKLVMTCTDLLTEAFGSKSVVITEVSTSVLTNLVQIAKDPSDDTWKGAATKVTAAWKSKFLRSAGSPNQTSSSRNSREVVMMMKLGLLLNDEAGVTQIHRRFQQQVEGDRGAFAMFVEHGRNELANKVLRNGWEHMSTSTSSTIVVNYNDSLETKIPEFLASVPREDLRYLAEILLTTLPEIKKQGDMNDAALSARTIAAAKKFSDITFSTPAMKEKSLVMLTRKSDALELLVKPLTEIASKTNLAALNDLDDHNLQQRKQALVTAYCRATIVTGNSQAVVDVLDGINKTKVRSDYYRRNAFDMVINAVYEVVTQRISEWSPEQIEKILPATRQLAIPQKNAPYAYRNRALPLNLLAHAAAGKPTELKKWYDELSDDQKKWFGESGFPYELWRLAPQVTGKATKENLDKRLDMAANLIRCATALDSFTLKNGRVYFKGRYSNPLVNNMTSYGLIPYNDLAEHGPKIAKAAPADGYAWAAISEAQQSQNKHADALESINKAVEAAGMKKLLAAEFRIKKAEILKRLKREDQAKEVLKEIEGVMLEPATQKRVDGLRKQLGLSPSDDKQSAKRRDHFHQALSA